MKDLTLTGFQKICNDLAPVKFVYDTDNQIGGKTSDLKIISFFTKAIVSLAPNCICFQGDGGILRLDRVKAIRICEGVGIPDIIFCIDCGNLNDNNDDITYVVTAKKF